MDKATHRKLSSRSLQTASAAQDVQSPTLDQESALTQHRQLQRRRGRVKASERFVFPVEFVESVSLDELTPPSVLRDSHAMRNE